MSTHYDFAIIGSGASGGVLAHQLHQAGARCVLLEAGKHFRAESFPRTELEYSPQLFWGGGLEFDQSSKMAFLRARCVGGTTNVNQCLLDRFDEIALNDWRCQSNIPFFTPETMQPHYAAIEQALHLENIEPRHFNRNTQLFIEGCDHNNFGWAPLRRGQTDCGLDEGNDCIGCLGGCHRDSKQSTLVGFIHKAEKTGLEIRDEFLAHSIKTHADGVTIQGEHHGKQEQIHAQKVILAAGSFGSTGLLLRSGFDKTLPALGKGFSAHPQFMSFALFDEVIDAHKGAFQGVKSQDPYFRQAGFKLENVFGPPISIAMLFNRLGPAHQDFMRNYRKMACIEVAIRDEAIGEIKLGAKGKLAIHKPLTQQDLHRRDMGLGTVEQLFVSLGAKETFQSPYYFGLHLMGGCAIGANPKESVVNEGFQVHGQERVYIADSSVFPNAPGINPALTIMALAERLSQQLIADHNGGQHHV